MSMSGHADVEHHELDLMTMGAPSPAGENFSMMAHQYHSLRRNPRRPDPPKGLPFPNAHPNPHIRHLQQEHVPKISVASTKGVNLLTRIPSRESIV
jgi:hypothetical protein